MEKTPSLMGENVGRAVGAALQSQDRSKPQAGQGYQAQRAQRSGQLRGTTEYPNGLF